MLASQSVSRSKRAEAHSNSADALTPLRRDVLALLKSAAGPLKAYEVLGKLAERRGARVAPPTIYRTLGHLVENGFAHRIESLGAYTACAHKSAGADHVFLICEACGSVSEIESTEASRALEAAVRRQHFVLSHASLELRGACAACSQARGR